MTEHPALDIQAFIDGGMLDEAALDRLEVRRARLALEHLRTRLGNDRMRELLADDIAAAEQRMKDWFATSAGNWKPAITEIAIPGIGGAGFVAWWTGRPKSGDEAGMRIAHPEHYIVHPRPDHLVEVVETVGQDDGPWRILLKFLEDPADIPLLPSLGYPIRVGALIMDEAGTTVGHAMHEFRDTQGGCHVRLTLNFPSAVPTRIIAGHQEHFAIEFRNWGRNAMEATS